MSSRLYVGEVMHQRFTPIKYHFVYKVFSLLVDIDTIKQESEQSKLLKLNRFGLLSLFTKDHGARDGSDWRKWISTQLKEHGIDQAGKIYLLCFPRVLGYTFNPMSVWYCEDTQGRLIATICEVSNTFGGKHHYLLHNQGKPVSLPLRSTADKVFHVSPFMDMNKTYQFRINQPAEQLSISINEYEEEQLVLVANQKGKAQEMTDRNLFKAFLMVPLLPFKIMTMIHWHALKIWLQGVKFHTTPTSSSNEGITQWPTKIEN